MHHLRLSLATRCFQQPLRQAIQTAAACGAKGLQFDVRDELRAVDLTDTGRRQFLHHLDEIGLRMASLLLPTRRGYTDEEHLDARVSATRQAMQFARQLRSNVLIARLGKIPADKESKPYRMLFDVVSDLARHGNQVGTTLAVTPTHDSPEALADFLGLIKTGPVGIDFDPAAFVMAGHPPQAALRQLHPLIVHFTARDAIRDIDGGGVEVPLGRGEVDWLELLPLLDEIAYPGWVTAVRTQGEDLGGDAARAIEFLRNVGMG
ncbi:MAG: sugar phosphate isomerase/epimerase family protein [Planctomycetales bacterium]